MTDDTRTHPARLELAEPLPPDIAVGSHTVARVKAWCEQGCALRGMRLTVTAPDGTVATHELDLAEDAASRGVEIELKAPRAVGDPVWRVALVCPTPASAAANLHDAATLDLRIRISPQRTSLAAWDVPSPVTVGAPFAVKVGAKSTAACDLRDMIIEVRDAAGAVAARGRLGDTPWPGTAALYWTTLELVAPPQPGLSTWSAHFAGTDIELPHDGAAVSFSVAVVPPPEHRLTVQVVESETAAPVAQAHLRLGAYGAVTDQSGHAEVLIAKGRYDLTVWKAGHEAPVTAVQVDRDLAMTIEVLKLPEENPDAAWQM